MYYLVDKKNEHGTYEVWSPRHVKDGDIAILHKFVTWDEVLEYMFNPIDWVKENLDEEIHEETG